jgi:hypothetical protein
MLNLIWNFEQGKNAKLKEKYEINLLRGEFLEWK